VRVEAGRIIEIGKLDARPDEHGIDAKGGLLIPGLHDHHIHMAATAMARMSVPCGPPDVHNEVQLAQALSIAGEGWIRGIGYHESVAGLLHVDHLDALVPDRPLRIQHRSGRMWFFNTPALDALLSLNSPSPRLEQVDGRWTGRLFDDDAWVRQSRIGGPPSFASVSAELARFGVTGITDMSVANVSQSAEHFAAELANGNLLQSCMVAGSISLGDADLPAGIMLGAAKLHLHEYNLPHPDDVVAFIKAAHAQGRAVASHCTTEVELVYTLSALQGAGAMHGDRIEHAGIVTDVLLTQIAELGLHIVSQPHFIAERGDQYLVDVPRADHDALYRLAAFQRAGVVLAAGSDAPYGSLDPWVAMRAAVQRKAPSGQSIGLDEALDPDQALQLYLAHPADLGQQRRVVVGAPADLCLLDRPWALARSRLQSDDVRCVLAGGRLIDNCVDQAPV
jgi:predicted amidohydrolase YtcJ